MVVKLKFYSYKKKYYNAIVSAETASISLTRPTGLSFYRWPVTSILLRWYIFRYIYIYIYIAYMVYTMVIKLKFYSYNSTIVQ